MRRSFLLTFIGYLDSCWADAEAAQCSNWQNRIRFSFL